MRREEGRGGKAVYILAQRQDYFADNAKAGDRSHIMTGGAVA